MSRDYYNRRIGTGTERPKLTLRETAELIGEAYTFIDQQCYMQRSFGFYCVDAQQVAGRDGYGIYKPFLLATGIRIESSIQNALQEGDEVFLFTMIEFMHDHVAKPVEGGRYHSYSGCGWHYRQDDTFDERTARAEWRAHVNKSLRYYDHGYELPEEGEIVHLAPDGTGSLLRAELPDKTSKTDREKVANAVRTFQLGRSTRAERKQAVRDLIDVLEFHKLRVQEHLLSKDASDLFNIANNFALRHHNERQKDDYDDSFLTWLFYMYLSTVHLILGIVAGQSAFIVKQLPPPPVSTGYDDIPF